MFNAADVLDSQNVAEVELSVVVLNEGIEGTNVSRGSLK
jgi:hypothetical protein